MSPLVLETLSHSLARDPDGIWRAGGAPVVSYAEDGHVECFQVEDRSFWFRHRNACIASMVGRHPFSGALLDIGGGNGYVARRLADDGHSVVLLEPGDVGARNARLARGLDHVVCATLEEAGFPTGTFGAVGMFDVIEHVEDDRRFLAASAEVLGVGGRLYLTVPCHSWLWSDADVAAGHFRRYTRDSLDRLLSGMFRIDYLSGFFQPLLLPQYLLRALPYRMGLGRGRRLMSVEAEHGTADGLATRAITALLRHEHARIGRNERLALRFSPSCLVAASRL